MTELMLADDPSQGVGELVFAGDLETPTRSLSVCLTHNERILEASTSGVVTVIQAWARDVVGPSDIRVVVLGEPDLG